MYRKKELEIAHLKRLLGELEPYTFKKIEKLSNWKYGNSLIDPPFSWEGDLAAFERDIYIEDENTYIHAWFGGESLVLVDGKSFGQFNPLQKDLWIGKFAGESHKFRIEVVPRGLFGSRENAIFEYANLVVVDENIRKIVDFTRAVLDLANEIDDEAFSKALIDASENFLGKIDIPRSTDKYLKASLYDSTIKDEITKVWNPPDIPDVDGFSLPNYEKILEEFEKYREKILSLRDIWPNEGKVFLAGQSHIDYAWLWPVEETKRKLRRTFSNALNLIEKYGITYIQSSAQMYEDVKREDPELFERIKKAVDKGFWEPIGGMWVEPDVVISSVESVARQLLYGQSFFEENFGERSNICWLPDSFGFPHTLPQILNDAGIDILITTKLNWNESNKFPYDLCIWRGLDGSEVIYYSFNNPNGGYNGEIKASSFLSVWRNHRQRHISPTALMPFGYGDGGGGPSDEMCRMIDSYSKLPKIPKSKVSTVKEFVKETFENIKDAKLPIWDGELYLELHRGVYTSESRTKALHRKAEVALRNLEIFSTLFDEDLQKEIDEKWKVVLRNEFHDILPGSSIKEVYTRAENELKEILDWTEEELDEVFKKHSEKSNFISVVNTSNFPRKIVFSLNEPLELEHDGEKIEFQKTFDGKYIYALSEEIQPLKSFNFKVVSNSYVNLKKGMENFLENDYMIVKVADGGIDIFSKKFKRSVFKEPSKLWIYKNVPYYWDNWDIDVNTELEGRTLAPDLIEFVEDGDIRSVIKLTYEYEGSRIEEFVILYKNSDVLTLEYKIDWHTRRVFLKRIFDVNALARKALFDVDGGYVERSTTRNTNFEKARFETFMHRWISISQNGFGVAFMNDVKYGCSVNGSKIGISLLKAGIFPNFFSDEGHHEFKLGVFVHDGSNIEEIIKRAEEFSFPIRIVKGKLNLPKIGISGGSFKLNALRNKKDEIVLRLVEVAGKSGRCKVNLWKKFQIHRSNILEDDLGKIEDRTSFFEFEYEPFKMYTFLLKT